MGRRTWLLLWLCMLCAASTAAMISNKPGSPRAGSETDCRAFVRKFYSWYLHGPGNHGGFEAAIAKRPRSFSPKLLQALRQDTAASRKSPGEIVGLDFDPFLNSQDVAERYDVGKVSRIGDRYLADIFGRYSGEKSKQPSLIAELHSEHGRWVFVNFHYPRDTGDKKSENLLAILAALKVERSKGK